VQIAGGYFTIVAEWGLIDTRDGISPTVRDGLFGTVKLYLDDP